MVVCSVRGIDASQHCLGISVWRRIDWVNANLYDHQHDCSVGRHETELCLGRLLHRVASITHARATGSTAGAYFEQKGERARTVRRRRL